MLQINKFVLIFLINFVNSIICFNVNFRENYDVKIEPFNTQIFKREMTQFFDKASYSFNGFEKIESIPVLFPIDICVLNLDGLKYAAALHRNKDGLRNFAVFKMNNGSYEQLVDLPTPKAVTMDCKAFGSKGYIAIANNITETVERAQDGSPIFEIAGDRIRSVQYFPLSNLASMYLRVAGNDLFLLHTYANTESTPNVYCPYFKWSGATFNKLGRIPCSNARHLEPFSIDYESYVAVANYADQRGRTKTFSEIYKFDPKKSKFQLFQKIKTNGAVDVKYFRVPIDEVKRQHFLIFGNSLSGKSVEQVRKIKREGKNPEADSIFYVFDKGQFIPYQRLSLYAVEKFLPVQNTDAEKFLLLIACNNQDTKIYNFNDWKFEESQAQFTEGALGRGVANMRIYQENDNSYLVIANEKMMENETNIFLPIFKQDEHANALRQQIIDWTKTTMERLKTIDVDKLRQDVEAKLSTSQQGKSSEFEVNDIPNANIQTVITKSLVHSRLRFNSNYWLALSHASKALDLLQAEHEAKQLGKRTVRETSDMRHKVTEYDLDYMNVATLRVKEKVNAKYVNGIEVAEPNFKSIKAKKIVVTDSFKAPTQAEEASKLHGSHEIINVENLQINGKLNNVTWHDLENNTLKREGVQFFKAPLTIDNLRADSVTVTSSEINKENLAKLVSIKEGNYVVNQDIQFEEPVQAKNVLIHERLKNIHIFEQKFDVLLKRSNETQVIEGTKHFQNLKVLEPITVAGQLLGKQWSSMTPSKAIHNSLTLNGDFIINGDVLINQLLNASNIIDVNANISLRDILQNGIRLDEPLENVNLKFMQPIEVNKTTVSFINTQDVQELVRTNYDDIQIVVGEKIFKNSLEIQKGFSEVKYLNGNDVGNLENQLLLKHTNQTIKVPMNFGRVIAKSIQAPNIKLNNKNLSDYLTNSTAQHINGTLKVDKLYAQRLEVENLNTNGKIFNAELTEIYQQKARSAPNAEIFRKNSKFHGSIYVKNLKINSTINERKIEDIENELMQLNGNIKYVGNFKFNYDMNVTNLTFYGKLNGITADEFGRCWMRHGAADAQSFSAAQTFANVKCESGIKLAGKLNGYTIDDYFAKTFWINRNEYINEAYFENSLQLQAELQTATVNNLRIPEDFLYGHSAEPQILYAELVVQDDVQVACDILNTSSINGLNLAAFENFLNGYSYDNTLHVENVHFKYAPHYKTLNHHNLQETLDKVWLANEDVDLMEHVEIAEGHFEGLLDFEGPINNINLEFLKENYFSLSRPQEISTQLVFTNNVTFKSYVRTENLYLFGPIIESKSKTQFDFNEFVANTLKKSGPHEVTGAWSIEEASVTGNLNNVRLNELNLVDDVVRFDSINEITAEKYIKAAVTINKLYATPTSTVNNINVAHWIRNAIYVYENYTIKGNTTIDTVNLYNDLRVCGNVNNIIFNEFNLLLRNLEQKIYGNVQIRNKFPAEQLILANNFENLQTKQLNGINVEEILSNQAQFGPNMQVQSHLVFKQPMVIQEYRGSDGIWSSMKLKRHTDSIDADEQTDVKNWHMLENAVEQLRKSLEEPHYMLNHFEVIQVLPTNATDLISLRLLYKHEFIDVVAILNENSLDGEYMEFYRWHNEKNKLILDENLSWLPQDKTLIDLLKLAFENAEILTASKSDDGDFYENIITSDTEGLLEVLQLKNEHIAGEVEVFDIKNENCFTIYDNKSIEIPIYCLELIEVARAKLKIYKKYAIPRSGVKQVLGITNQTIALLFADAMEIWNTSDSLQMQQRLPLILPKQLTVGVEKESVYVAVLSEIKTNSLHHGAIEIYKSTNGANYQHLQSLDCIEPQQIVFSYIQQSQDLLLYIITTTVNEPLLVYQYNGVLGFKKFMGATTLPATKNMELVELQEAKRHLFALFGKDEITFVEIKLNKL